MAGLDGRGRPTWLEDLEAWCSRKGSMSKAMEKGGRPGLPMKPSHVRKSLNRIKRLLCHTEPPFIEVSGQNGKAYTYRALRDARDLKPTDLAHAIDVLFPEGATADVAVTHKHYAEAAVLLGRYLAFGIMHRGRGVWSIDDVKRIHELVPTRRVKVERLQVIDPQRFDMFLDWTRPVSPEHWAALWIMRKVGLRFSGMRGAYRDLHNENSTFQIARGMWKIYEKVYVRSYEVTKQVALFLAEWETELVKLHPNVPWLFPTSNGTRWCEDPSSFNKVIRGLWVRWIEATGQVLDQDEVRMVHAHMCRHVCATNLAIQGVQPSVIQEYMGHQDLRTTQRYIQITGSKQRSFIDAADAASMSVADSPPSSTAISHRESVLSAIREMDPAERKSLLGELLKELTA